MSARISVPSYVVPGTYLENLRFLFNETNQRAVELLFFLFDDEMKTLLANELDGIRNFSEHFAFTLHMPDQVQPEHSAILECTADFVKSYVVHPPWDTGQTDAFAAVFNEWRALYGSDRFFLENTRMPQFDAAFSALTQSPLGAPRVCADIGHLMLEGIDPARWIPRYAALISELHIHGCDGTRDHIMFSRDALWLSELSSFVKNFTGVIEIELFSWSDVHEARSILRAAWEL